MIGINIDKIIYILIGLLIFVSLFGTGFVVGGMYGSLNTAMWYEQNLEALEQDIRLDNLEIKINDDLSDFEEVSVKIEPNEEFNKKQNYTYK